jgi:hypothetical protein
MNFSRRDHLKTEDKKTLAWLEVAQRVLAGGYADSDKSTLKSIAIGLQSLQHPDCQKALCQIVGLKERL